MFRAALIRLTLLYLLIIMTISLFFSIIVYQTSMQVINKGFGRQQNAIERLGRNSVLQNNPSYLAERELIADEARENILKNLLYTNIIILIMGGGLSYFLAGQTLRPIEEAHEAQSRFTGDASHELRTPLAAMKAEIEVALRNPGLTKSDAVLLLRSNLEEVERLKDLSDGLLELSRDHGKSVKGTDFVLSELIQKTVTEAKKLAKPKNITIEQNLDNDIRVHGNSTQVHELLVILLDNALKYSEADKKITIESSTKGKNAVIKVRDEGIGIDQDDLAKVFERFYRIEKSRTKNTTPGYGLGLALAKKIVSANNGSITAESKVGVGSIFTIKLPLA